LPDATPTPIAPPSPVRRNRAWVAAQIVLTAVVVWFVGTTLVDQWREFRGVTFVTRPDWRFIVGSGVVVLLAYAVLIETLRRILLSWAAPSETDNRPPLSFMGVARMWSISNFGRYIPGKVWGIGAMATMAHEAGIPAVAAAGSAVLNTVVNIATGFLVALIAGWRSFDEISKGRTWIGIALLIVAALGIVALPAILPRMLDVVRRVTRREISVTSVPHRAVYIALVGNLVSWLVYGAAFQLFVFGVVGEATGSFADYVTAYAWPYILGYLAIFAPGGLVVRDGALVVALTTLGIAPPQQALLISLTSRLWLTVLELLPGVLFLAAGARPRSKAT
jgi:glycosyltransferase 2 family protein